MPYVDQQSREKFKEILDKLLITPIEKKGELEYLIFLLMRQYMSKKEWNYSNLHDTVYAAAHCSHEFERRFLDDRENFAIESNGDIF